MNAPQQRQGLWRFARNVSSLLTSDVVNRATSFVVYAAVGRSLGAMSFGQLLLAVSLFQLFARFSTLGLRDLVTREVAKDTGQTGRYLGNAGLLILGGSILASGAILILVALLGYASETVRVILFLFLGLLPFGITRVTEAVFIAWEQAKYIAWVNIPINLIQTTVALWLVLSGHNVGLVAVSMAAAYLAMAVLQWGLAVRMARPESYLLSLSFCRELLGSTVPFFGMQATIAITASINIVLLSKFVGEVGVGVYSAATQLLVPLVLVTETVASVLFPSMVRQARRGVGHLKRITHQAAEFTIAFILPAVALLVILGGSLLTAIYGSDPEFDESRRVLQILSFKQIELGITAIFARTLLTLGAEKRLLRILAVRTVVQLVAAFLLIWRYGVIGAAVAALIVGFVNVVMHYTSTARLLSGFGLLAALWRPAVGAAAMTVFLAVTSNLHDLIRLAGSGVIYLGVLGGLIAMSPGGFGRLWIQDTADEADTADAETSDPSG
jgi:O-antigen/teichoic acid export membrane protein